MSRKPTRRVIRDQEIPLPFYQLCAKRVLFLLEPIMVDEKPLLYLLANAYYQGVADVVDVMEKSQ